MNKIYNNKSPFKVVKIMIDSERYVCSGFLRNCVKFFCWSAVDCTCLVVPPLFFNDFMPVKPVKLARIIQKLYLACLKMNKNVVNGQIFNNQTIILRGCITYFIYRKNSNRLCNFKSWFEGARKICRSTWLPQFARGKSRGHGAF